MTFEEAMREVEKEDACDIGRGVSASGIFFDEAVNLDDFTYPLPDAE